MRERRLKTNPFLRKGLFFLIINIEVFDMLSKENKTGLKSKNSSINPGIMDQIISILNSTFHGNVALIYQNSRLVQIERNEKIRPSDLNSGNNHLPQGLKENCDLPAVRLRIQAAFEKMEYGQVVIVIKEGKIVQIDRTEKQRFPELVGLYGDGI
ncbi:MAG: hypothetical protein H6Q68_3266 [Firmicutes bacterium]|nr:hypothetical protein [Bacillota bacterium]